MLPAIVALQILLLIAVVLLLRRPAANTAPDPRQLQVPDQLARVDARAEALDGYLRAGLAQMRTDLSAEAHAAREADAIAAAALRQEITQSVATLGTTLNAGLDGFRIDNKASAETLRTAVQQNLDSLAQRLSGFIADTGRNQIEAQSALHSKLTELSSTNVNHQEKLRSTVSDALLKLNTDNSAKLEEMRATVDEKLHATLHTRLTESFGQVTDQLNKVHNGLGEMSKLSEGMDDLSRIFTNVKSRGGFAEVQLGMLLEQMLAPSQFVRNARVKPNTQEVVEFAVRFPSAAGEVLLPIDAKFPREDWERLEDAYTANNPELLAVAGKAFELAIRVEGKRICEKYINPPQTTPHAIMFLPTEGLYAEVMRRDSLQAEIQSKCRVTIAGPSTLSAILTSFQMGFHMLALQEKGDEVWKVLESAKTEFGKFGVLMDKVEKQVGTVQNTLREIGSKTTTINRTLREVGDSGPSGELDFGEPAPTPLRLVANAED
jgi:DNA recombination protein RmuC